MNSENQTKKMQLLPTKARKPLLTGTALALLLMSIFLLGVKDPNPEWGKYWMVKPILMVSLAGCLGSYWFYLFYFSISLQGWKKIVACITGIIGYLIAIWLGSVLGLNGTLWN